MLIDDRNALVVDGDDEGVAKLAERNHRPDVAIGSRLRPTPDRRAGTSPGPASPAGHYGRSRLRRSTATHRFGYTPPARMPGSPRRPDRGTARLRMQLQLRRAGLSERVHQRPAHHLVNQRLLAEADLGLRRMDVDVDRLRRHLEKEMHFRAALLDRRDAVGVENRVRDRLVLDDAPVDEDVLAPRVGPCSASAGDVPGEPETAGTLADLDQIVALAVEFDTGDRAASRGRTLKERPRRRWSA